MLRSSTRIAAGLDPDLALWFPEETSCREISTVKSFEVSSFSCSSSGNSARTRPLNNRATSNTKGRPLRVGRLDTISAVLYSEPSANFNYIYTTMNLFIIRWLFEVRRVKACAPVSAG